MSTENNTHVPLTQAKATQIAEAYARFSQLRGTAIKTPTADAELKGLSEFLANELINHASEFIGCWFAVRNEYEPILGLLARVSQRIHGINAMQQSAAAAPAAESNVVQLPKS